MPDLLIELFSEEIPARMQARAAADLQKLVTNGLVEAGLTYASAGAFRPRAVWRCRSRDFWRQALRHERNAKAPAWMRPKRRWRGSCVRPV